jgi:hypothetical protein
VNVGGVFALIADRESSFSVIDIGRNTVCERAMEFHDCTVKEALKNWS